MTIVNWEAEYNRRFPGIKSHAHHVRLTELFTVHTTADSPSSSGKIRWFWIVDLHGVPYQMGVMEGPPDSNEFDVAHVIATLLIQDLDDAEAVLKNVLYPPYLGR